jgi:D-arabinose 1-dehydrogenase-like Zn-dependent alcohol dehydrogenase
MSTIEAVVVTPDAPARLAVGKAPAPSPGPSEAVVRVAAVSLNPFDLRHAQSAPPGTTVGVDLAGTVLEAAPDGSGPTTGTRVIGWLPEGAWAEKVAVPTDTLAALPDGGSLTEAAALPTAGQGRTRPRIGVANDLRDGEGAPRVLHDDGADVAIGHSFASHQWDHVLEDVGVPFAAVLRQPRLRVDVHADHELS